MFEMDEKEVQAVRRVIHSRKLFRYQPGNLGECDRFERAFAQKLGVEYSIILSSGTNAIVAALVALGIGPGDEVLVPAYTFVATAAAVVLAGATPVVVNIDEQLGMSVEDAQSKITPKTRAIIPVHMDGLSADLKGLLALAKKHRLKVVEDCAQALGGSYQGQSLGSWGNAGAFSLNDNKHLSCGEGGVVVSSDRSLYPKLFYLQDLSARYNPNQQKAFESDFKKEFEEEAKNLEFFLGMSMRVSEIQGAIMRVQLSRLSSILKRLRERKKILLEVLEGTPGVSLIRGHCLKGDCGSSFHLRFDDPQKAQAMSRKLIANKVIAILPSMRPAHVAWKWYKDVGASTQTAGGVAEFLPSISIIMSVLRYELDINLTKKQTHALGVKIKKLVRT